MKKTRKLLCMTLAVLLLASCSGGKSGQQNNSSSQQNNSSGAASSAQTQDNYPEKPVEVIISFSAGGETDTLARLLFQHAEKYFGQKFAVVNKPGASGEIGWTELSQAEADGYTIGLISPPTFIFHPLQRPTCKYTLESFDIIANVVTDPQCILVKGDSPIQSLQDLYDQASASSVSIGYSGPGTTEALMLHQLDQAMGGELEKIPYDGSAPSVAALLGGHIDAVCMNVSGAVTHTADGSLRMLAVCSDERAEAYPDIPTFIEQGADIVSETHRGIAGPAGIPANRIKEIQDAIEKTLNDEEFIKQISEMNQPLNYLNSSDFTSLIISLGETYAQEIEEGGW